VERVGHRINKGRFIAGRDEPSTGVVNKFRDAGDGRRDHRPRQRQRFHQHDGQTFREARQHEGAGPEEMLSDFWRGADADERNNVLQPTTTDLVF
jgi:hypothetical protein